MEIKDLKLIPPSKRATAFLRNFMKEHDKGLKAIKTLADIKKIMKKHCRKCQKHKFYHFQLCCTCKYTDILQKINEVEDEFTL